MADDKKKNKSALSKVTSNAKAQEASKKKKPAVQQEKKKGRFKEYFKGVRLETKKVVWPTRKELVSYTVVVFIACAFFGLFLWGVDSGFLAIIREVFSVNI